LKVNTRAHTKKKEVFTFGRLGGDAQDAANFWAFPRLIESNENGFVGGGNKSTFNWRVIFWHLYFGNGHQSES